MTFTTINKKVTSKLILIIILFLLSLISVFISIKLGSVKITTCELIKILMSKTYSQNSSIIWNIRIPRTLTAGFVGMSLALSGCILQGIMNNPLAAPNIIGVSSGAGIAVWIIMVLLPGAFRMLIPFAFAGALITTLLIYFLAWKKGTSPVRLVLAGVAVSAFLGAGIKALMILFPDRVQLVLGFMVGGLEMRTWKHFYMIAPYFTISFIILMLFSQPLNILMLGDEKARSLGVNVEAIRLFYIIISSILAASAVSIAGLLGFVGLIVPHTARILIGSDYKYLLPASALLGAVLLVLSDTLARMLFNPVEIPVGIIMAVIGAPFFLYLLRNRIKK